MTNHIPAPRIPGTIRMIALIIIIALLTTHATNAQNVLDKTGLTSTALPTAAYSFRLLSSSYTGKALKILRTSDNATSDIGFTAGGDLDTPTLKTFVGSANGLVTTWYDQSGNALNLTQATQAAMPVLVNAGVINRENSQPFVRFFGSGTTYNSINLATAMTTVGHVSAVMKLSSTGDGFILSWTGGYNWHSNAQSTLFNGTWASTSVQSGNAWSNGNAYAPLSVPWPTTLTIDEVEPATPGTGTTWDNLGSDRNQYHDISNGGGYGEMIVFPAALSAADRQTLETNQGTYFTITVLPVTWLSFTAHTQTDGSVLLQWQTATEQNTASFTVQYSTDGQTWTSLATLPAPGNSTGTQTYRYEHTNPPPGKTYYRLQQTDLDGNASYSTIVVVDVPASTKNNGEFQVLQNPVTHRTLRIRVYRPTTLRLYSIDGKLLQLAHYDAGDTQLNLSGYPNGTYLLSGQTTSVQILVQ